MTVAPESPAVYDDAIRGGRAMHVLSPDGRRRPLDLARWVRDADDVDLAVLDRCDGVTLDVGCGPGRMAAALVRRGRPALGVDVSRAATESAAARGAPVLHRSVFEPLPAEGRWGTVLLADGNLGIGGDPTRLLDRARELLRPGGLLLVEPEPREVDRVVILSLQSADGTVTSKPFAWGRLGPTATMERATRAGYRVEDSWSLGGRAFVALRA
jgi:SAM-dependent methyltransferase